MKTPVSVNQSGGKMNEIQEQAEKLSYLASLMFHHLRAENKLPSWKSKMRYYRRELFDALADYAATGKEHAMDVRMSDAAAAVDACEVLIKSYKTDNGYKWLALELLDKFSEIFALCHVELALGAAPRN
jgi:hypothetical protein